MREYKSDAKIRPYRRLEGGVPAIRDFISQVLKSCKRQGSFSVAVPSRSRVIFIFVSQQTELTQSNTCQLGVIRYRTRNMKNKLYLILGPTHRMYAVVYRFASQ